MPSHRKYMDASKDASPWNKTTGTEKANSKRFVNAFTNRSPFLYKINHSLHMLSNSTRTNQHAQLYTAPPLFFFLTALLPLELFICTAPSCSSINVVSDPRAKTCGAGTDCGNPD